MPSEDVDGARSLFVSGTTAADEERWADAVDHLRRAYELSCAPTALFNLGVALRALGRQREARDVFGVLLDEHHDLPPDMSSQARTYLREAAARIAVLELVGLDADLRAELLFDGHRVEDDGARPVRLEADPGGHSLLVRVPRHQPFVWSGELHAAQVERVSIELEPLSPSGGVDPLVVVLPVVGALVIVAAIVAGVVLQDEAQLRPLFPERTVTVGAAR